MILVTGASGFVGKALCLNLVRHYPIKISVRDKSSVETSPNWETFEATLCSGHDWSAALLGVTVVVHCAARVHLMNEKSNYSLSEFRRVNVDGTIKLARQAYQSGVRRFIYLSSVKVNGEYTEVGCPFTTEQIANPSEPYGISKYEAEMGLRALSEKTGMEVVIIRSPLVYGPGVKANFLSMINWLQRGLPLPLGGVKKNLRSLIFLDNLVDMITLCVNHPAAANQTFLVSDDEDLSTSELLCRMANALGSASKLIPVPVNLIILGARLVGKTEMAQRLCGSLQVDIRKSKELLGWMPPVTLDDGLRQTAAHFFKMQS